MIEQAAAIGLYIAAIWVGGFLLGYAIGTNRAIKKTTRSRRTATAEYRDFDPSDLRVFQRREQAIHHPYPQLVEDGIITETDFLTRDVNWVHQKWVETYGEDPR